MWRDMRIGKRLTLSFSALFAILLLTAASGFWGLREVAATADHVLTTDAALAEHSARARANTLGLRRFEKDLFLSLASPELAASYLAKWYDQRDRLRARLEDLARIASREEDKTAVRSMERDLASYEFGMQVVLAGLERGSVTSPRQANDTIHAQKEEILPEIVGNMSGTNFRTRSNTSSMHTFRAARTTRL